MMRHFLNFQIHYANCQPLLNFKYPVMFVKFGGFSWKRKTQELTAGHIQVIGKTGNSELQDLVLIFQKSEQYLWL